MNTTLTTFKIIASLFLVILLGTQTVQAQATAVQAYGQLSVSGTKIVDKTGSPVQLRGMSLFWSIWQDKYYSYNTIKWLRDDWCINVVRAAMTVDINEGGTNKGYKWNEAAELAKVETVIDAAIDLGIYVIVDFHSHHANESQEKDLATKFFTHISTKYKGYPNIIYEPFNEPLNVSWSGTLKPFYNNIISTIRANDPKNIIVLGTPNWDQDVDVAANDPVSGSNIAYALHYYAASHKQDKRNKASTAISKGICLFATEYGICSADGNGVIDEPEANTWWTFLDNNKISHCNWAVSDKNEKASALNTNASPNGSWSASNLRESGVIVRNMMKANCPNYGNPPVDTYVNIPSKIEAESFSAMSGVQTETTTDAGGGSNVGYIESGDWIEFKVDAQAAGVYDIEYRVASNVATGKFNLLIDGAVSHSVTIVSTGGWQTWTTIKKTASFTKGQHTVRILATGDSWNINYINFLKTGIVDCNGVTDGTASVDNCGVCSGGNTGKTPNSTCTKDCFGVWKGTAAVDNCGVCAGGTTGNTPNSTCSGACSSGLGTKGFYDDFSLASDPFHLNGGVYFWGEEKLSGDDNPRFQALLARNKTNKRLDVTLTQGQGDYVPFGVSFGEISNKKVSIDLSTDATFEFEITNTSNKNIKLAAAIQDINGDIINISSGASGKLFSQAYLYELSKTINAGETVTFVGDFGNGFKADYNTNSYVSKFDYSKVTTMMFTVVSQTNTGAPDYAPLALTGIKINLKNVRLGDCANAYNYNNRNFDCNGDLDGTAAIDQCNVCSGGKTGKAVDTCINGLNDEKSSRINVFPNPANNFIQLDGKFENWSLTDYTGHLLNEGSDSEIDLSNQKTGLYLLKIDGEVYKIIKE